MFDPVSAIVGGAIIGGGLGYLSSENQADAASSAASSQAASASQSNQLQMQMYNQNRADMAPWRTAGTTAINQLSNLMSPNGQLYNTNFTAQDFYNNIDPGYAWRKQEGINALTASGVASGNYGGGALGTALVNYGQNAASAEYQNAYNRWMNNNTTLFNRLSGVSGTGQTAATQIGNQGVTTAGIMGNNLTNASYLGGQYNMAAANANTQGMAGINNAFQSGLGNYLTYQDQLNQLNTMYSGAQYNPYTGAGANYSNNYGYQYFPSEGTWG